jgi:hypothetical protein
VTTTLLWTILIVAIVGLVVLQFLSARAARRVGGGSARWVIVLRIVNVIALLLLLGWVVYVQATR